MATFTTRYGDTLYHTDQYQPSRVFTFGPWDLPYKAVNILCPDGKYRTVRTAQMADTFWTIRARVSYRGKTVTGYLTTETDDDDYSRHQIIFHATGKYADIFG